MQPAHGVPVFSAWPRVPCLTKCVWSGKPSSPLGHGYPGVNESCSQPAFLERRARAWVLIYLNGFIPIQTVHLLPHLLLPTVVQRFHVVSNSHLVKKSTTNMFIFSLHTVFMTFLKKIILKVSQIVASLPGFTTQFSSSFILWWQNLLEFTFIQRWGWISGTIWQVFILDMATTAEQVADLASFSGVHHCTSVPLSDIHGQCDCLSWDADSHCARWTTHRVDGLILFWVGHLKHCGLCHLPLGLRGHLWSETSI